MAECNRRPHGERHFVELHKKLSANGFPVVGLDLKRSHLPEFLVVEELKAEIRLDQFLGIAKDDEDTRPKNSQPKYSKEKRTKMEEAFLALVPLTWQYLRMANFSARQVAWTGDQWVMFDLEEPNFQIGLLANRKTTFDTLVYEGQFGTEREDILPETLMNKANALVLAERKRMSREYKWFQRLPESTRQERWLLKHIYRQDQMIGRYFALTLVPFATGELWDWEPFDSEVSLPPTRKLPFKIVKVISKTSKSIVYEIELVDERKTALLELQIKSERDKEFGVVWQSGWTMDNIKSGNDFKIYTK